MGHLSFPLLFFFSSRLLSHVFDPDLDKATPREYIVYACPMGPLGASIEEFMENCLTHTGRNGAHKSFPHVTLCQFFKVRMCFREGYSSVIHVQCTCVQYSLYLLKYCIK